jgi:energy-coupling factor transporter transmembrane protein EcfT
MMRKGSKSYQAPGSLVAAFYLLLVAWTAVSILFLSAKAARSELTDALQWVMIVAIFGFTWYFSLGLFYRISQAPDDRLYLKGVRRSLTVHPREIEVVEGPYLPIGFVRFKAGKERLYLICQLRNADLQAILKRIGEINPHVRFKTK